MIKNKQKLLTLRSIYNWQLNNEELSAEERDRAERLLKVVNKDLKEIYDGELKNVGVTVKYE